MKKLRIQGFTIVELLTVIVIIGILASLVIVAYNGIQQRAADASRNADLSTYHKAIMAARINTNQSLVQITGSGWSVGNCISAGSNPTATEPKNLAKSHSCWIRYYSDLTNIGNAALMDLSGLRDGDTRGNPYVFDQNEGESGDFCRTDGSLNYFSGNGITQSVYSAIPKYFPTC
jgi:prepilin-type N-terminal cleavage/methylation domain-containing protein